MKQNLISPVSWRIMSEEELFKISWLDPQQRQATWGKINKRESASKWNDWEITLTELYQIKLDITRILSEQQSEFIDIIKSAIWDKVKKINNPIYQWWSTLLNLNIADTHFNRIEHSNPQKYLEWIRSRVMRLFEKWLKEKPDKVLFVDYWDFFNDNWDWKTEKWTVQHSHKNVSDMFAIAIQFKKLLYDAISSELPLDVLEIWWNHDRQIHKMLAEALKVIYSWTNNVTVDVVDNFRQYYRRWDTLTWHSHWDWEKEKDLLWIMNAEQKLWKYNYFTRWHTHAEQSKVLWPIHIDVIPTTAIPSAREKNQWYLWQWKVKSKLYHKKLWKITENYQ